MRKVLGAIGAVIVIILLVTAGWLIWAYHDSKHLRRQERISHLKTRGYQEVLDSDGSVKFIKVMPDGSIKAVRVKGVTPTAGLPRMTTTPTGTIIVPPPAPQAGSPPVVVNSTGAAVNKAGVVAPQNAGTTPQTGTAAPQTVATAPQTTAVTRTEPAHSPIVAMSGTPTSHSQVPGPITATSPTATTTSIPDSQATKHIVKHVRYGPHGEKIVEKYKVKLNQSGNVAAVKYKAKVKSELHGRKAVLKQCAGEHHETKVNKLHKVKAIGSHKMPTNCHEGVTYKMKIKAVHSEGISKDKMTGEVDACHPHKIHQGTLAEFSGAPMKPHPTIEYRLRVKYFGAGHLPLHENSHHKYGHIVNVAHISKHHKHALNKHIRKLRKKLKKSLKHATLHPHEQQQQQEELPHRVTTIERDTHSTKFCNGEEEQALPSRSQVQFKKHYVKPHKSHQQVKLKIVIFQHHFHDLLGHKHKVETHHWDDPHHPGLHTVKVGRHLIRLNREYEPMVPHLPEDHNRTEQHHVDQKQSHKMIVPPHVYHQNHHFFRGFKNIWQLPDRKYNHHAYQCWNNVPQEVAFDPKYYGHHKNVIIEVPRDGHGKPVPVDDETHVIFCVRAK